jgi:acetylornithine deacetylase
VIDQASPSLEFGQRLDEAIQEHEHWAHRLLERLVNVPSLLGQERAAQLVLAAELERLGFEVSWLDIPPSIAEDPAAGVPAIAYDGRQVVVGRLAGAAPNAGRSLLINGHLDVVPAGDAHAWSSAPFQATDVGGWLQGRGAGDMKAGFAMATLAISALLATAGRPRGDLIVVGVIEEECTGNGTLASVRAGVLADAVLLPEPTDLQVLTSGVGVLWVDVLVAGSAAHAESAASAVSAIERIEPVLVGLRALAEDLNCGLDQPRYLVNVGQVRAGDWPSTVPGSAELRVRVGFPAELSPDDAHARVCATVARAAKSDPWLASHPPVVRPSGFRAAGYALPEDSEILRTLSAAHVEAHGAHPVVVSTNATTDARHYLNEAGVPALCFGPRARGMHSVDEAVELASIAAGARTLGRFMADWLGIRHGPVAPDVPDGATGGSLAGSA